MKNNIFKIILGSIFLILFNGFFFYLGGTKHPDVNWISYGFIHTSYLCILLTPFFCQSGKGLEVLSYSLYFRALLYFFIELIVGITCIVITPENTTWPLIIQGTLLTIFILLQIMSVLANDATIESLQKQKEESIYIQSMAQSIRSSMREISNPTIKKQVERCYDAVNNCSLQTCQEAQDAELYLRNAVELLCSAIKENDNPRILSEANNVINAVHNRNAIIKKCRFN